MRDGALRGGFPRSPFHGLCRALALLLVAVLPAACGFHPRGSAFPVGDPGRLFVDADRGSSVEEPLREALRERSFVLVDDRDEADVVLRLSDERQTQRIVSVRSTGRVSEFELVHALDMRIERAPSGSATSDEFAVPDARPAEAFDAAPRTEAALPPTADRVVVTREYTYDEAQVLGKENEARILRREMSEELVRQIVLRTIASLAPRTPDTGLPPASANGEAGTQ